MHKSEIIRYYFHLSIERSSLIRASRVAVLVGIILILINNPEILSGNFSDLNQGSIVMSFLVPFLVSTYSSILSHNKIKPGEISPIDGALKCNNCKKANFHIQIGQEAGECPQCKTDTRWKITRIFNASPSQNDMIKSLALFARHNPQPLFRIDADGIIIASNPASNLLLKNENPSNENITILLPELKQFDFNQIIENEEEKKIVISIKGEFFNLMLKGVSALKTVHIYGNDITQIVLAEQKIKSQAHEINESIQYAWLIQKAMLPHSKLFDTIFPSHFIFYRPLNIVSGDFYWVNNVEHLKILAVADSTGHGVPGAFMSMIGISILNEIILREKIYEPDKILNSLRERIIFSLSSGNKSNDVSDGMDIALIVINTNDNTLSFSGAYNPLYILRNGELIIIKADHMPVGKFINDHLSFNLTKTNIKPNDRLFLFTDGFKDQWGGEKGKKYSSIAFQKLIIELGKSPFDKQLNIMSTVFDTWKSDNEQLDDVLVVGIEI